MDDKTQLYSPFRADDATIANTQLDVTGQEVGRGLLGLKLDGVDFQHLYPVL